MNSNALPLLLHVAPGDPEPVRDQIARQLRDRIVRGELPTGELLPGHRQLARQYRVAPSTVEAAYHLLVVDGLLTGEPAEEVRVAELAVERRRDLVERLQLEKLVAQELGRRELEMARDVQRRLLPPAELEGPGWQVAARCLPARVVAGDFYDFRTEARFRLALIAVNTFLIAEDDEARLAILTTMRRSLRPGGIAAVEVGTPDEAELTRFDGRRQHEWLRIDPETGEEVTKTISATNAFFVRLLCPCLMRW